MKLRLPALVPRFDVTLAVVALVILLSAAVAYYVHSTLREIRYDLPVTLSQQERDIAILVLDTGELLRGAQRARSDPGPAQAAALLRQVATIEQRLREMARFYNFANMVGASALHAALRPALAEIRGLLTEGYNGLAPGSEASLQAVEARAMALHDEARGLFSAAGTTAVELLEQDARRIERFRLGLPLVILVLAALGLLLLVFANRRRRAELALRASETRFQDFAEVGSDFFWETGPDLRFTFVSENFEQIAGISPAAAGRLRPEEIWAPGEGGHEPVPGTALSHQVAALQARQAFRNLRVEWRHPDRGTIVLSLSGRPMTDDKGAFLGYRGSGSDLTREVLARQRERNLESRLHDVINSLPLAFHLWGPDGRLVMANKAQLEWVPDYRDVMRPGMRFEDLVRFDAEQGLVKEAEGRVEGYIRERLERFRRGAGEGVTELWLKDRWLHVIDHRLPDGSTICLRVDITELKDREAQLVQAQKMEALGQLTGGVAHDFNNLLAAIIGNLELIGDAVAQDAKTLERVSRALCAAGLGADLTHRLLAFSRKQSLRPRAIDVGELLPGMASLLARTLGENIDIDIAPSEAVSPCLADRAQLENAILNLAINARDAMPGGGRLTISARDVALGEEEATALGELRAGAYVMISVADSGAGMSRETRDNAFQPFFTTKGADQGTGLGLAMVYGFVKQSGGHAVIESEEGRGTVVRLYLPRGDSAERPSAEEEVEESPRGRGESVLVVEDEAQVRALAVETLRDLGYEVVAAEDGPQALARIDRQGAPDLLVTDVVLPGGLSGAELAERVRRQRPETAVLFMSGYGAAALAHEGARDTERELIHKPFRRYRLAERVRALLDARTAAPPVEGTPEGEARETQVG